MDSEDASAVANDPAIALNDSAQVVSQPYFHQTFLFIIDHVHNEPRFAHLLDFIDHECLCKFLKLSEQSQRIFLILFRRSRQLFRVKKLHLSSELTADEIRVSIEELAKQGFLSRELADVPDFELLSMLERKEINDLALTFKLPIKGLCKSGIITKLIKSSREPSVMSFFGAKKATKTSRLRHLTESSLGPCFLLVKAYVDVFVRQLLLFSLASEKGGPQSRPMSLPAFLSSEMYNLLLVRRGELKYPDYKISRNSAVFRSRDDFSKFCELYFLRHQLDCLVSTSDYNQAYEHFSKYRDLLSSVISDSEYYRNDLPRFLQTFSLPHRAVRLIRLGVGICERLRRYREAVALVLIPLSSPCLLSSATSRSVCFFIQRLILDQGNHCRDTVSCAKTVVGLFPTMCGLHPGHRLELQRQIGRALEKKNCWGQSQLADANEIPSKSKRARKGGSQRVEEGADATLIKEFEEICTKLLPPLKSAPLVKLSAPVVGSSADLGAHRPMYVWTEPVGSAGDASTASSLLHVEEWVLKHYIHNMGFEKGFHCESRAYTSLFGLLFYDLLYTVDRRDAFYSMRQVAPLDLLTGEFYASQKDAIEARLEMISSAKDNSHHHSLSNSPEGDVGPLDPVSKLLTMVWTEHKDERCIGVNWDLFPGGERDIFDLFWCLGPKLVASICRLLVKDYRNWSSGLPDLCVWSPSVGKAKLIEVKGPGDQLSCQQIVWIDQLLSFGADVELCTVAAVSRNSLKLR